MPELIDRLLLIDRLDQGQKIALDAKDFMSFYALVCFKAILQETPTIEAEPVKHGTLLEGEIFNDSRCSECGQVFRDDIRFVYPCDESSVCKIPKRCPECGCYWDGGEDDAEH